MSSDSKPWVFLPPRDFPELWWDPGVEGQWCFWEEPEEMATTSCCQALGCRRTHIHLVHVEQALARAPGESGDEEGRAGKGR